MSKKLFAMPLRVLVISLLFFGMSHAQDIRSAGNPSAKITVEEFASLTCPHCGTFHKTIVKELLPDYIESGQIQYIYRDFPLDGTALGASMLAECVAGDNNDRYFKFIDVLYEKQEQWTQTNDIKQALFGYAALAGLNQKSAEACLKNETIYNKVIADRELGENKGVNSTPSVYINGKKLNDFSQSGIKKKLDSLIQ